MRRRGQDHFTLHRERPRPIGIEGGCQIIDTHVAVAKMRIGQHRQRVNSIGRVVDIMSGRRLVSHLKVQVRERARIAGFRACATIGARNARGATQCIVGAAGLVFALIGVVTAGFANMRALVDKRVHRRCQRGAEMLVNGVITGIAVAIHGDARIAMAGYGGAETVRFSARPAMPQHDAAVSPATGHISDHPIGGGKHGRADFRGHVDAAMPIVDKVGGRERSRPVRRGEWKIGIVGTDAAAVTDITIGPAPILIMGRGDSATQGPGDIGIKCCGLSRSGKRIGQTKGDHDAIDRGFYH